MGELNKDKNKIEVESKKENGSLSMSGMLLKIPQTIDAYGKLTIGLASIGIIGAVFGILGWRMLDLQQHTEQSSRQAEMLMVNNLLQNIDETQLEINETQEQIASFIELVSENVDALNKEREQRLRIESEGVDELNRIRIAIERWSNQSK